MHRLTVGGILRLLGLRQHKEHSESSSYSVTHLSLIDDRTEARNNQSASDGTPNRKTSANPAEFYRAQPVLDRRIHVIGMGNVGKFIAHSLRGIPNPPPVSLIFDTPAKLALWERSGRRLEVITEGDEERRGGFEAEYAAPRIRYHKKEIQSSSGDPFPNPSASGPGTESSDPIHSLIVCTKTPKVIQALSAVKHRLHRQSIILFLQNGMGTVDEVNREVFPDPEHRPYYMVGINSHGMHGTDNPFTTVHAGFGTISLGILPHEREREPAPYAPTPKFRPKQDSPVEPKNEADPDASTPTPTSTSFRLTANKRYLLRTLLRTPVLSATAFSPPDLLQMQLDKLAVNCVINPLTVMLDARNGAILYTYSISRVMRLLLSEISLVIRSLPELQHIPNVQQRFDPGRLETVVVGVANATKDNISSMLADVRAGRQTEVEYMNGWIVKRGEELGVMCMANYMLMHIVKGKSGMVQREIGEGVPFVQTNPGEGEIVLAEEKTTEA